MVTLRGNFHMWDPEGRYEGIYAPVQKINNFQRTAEKFLPFLFFCNTFVTPTVLTLVM